MSCIVTGWLAMQYPDILRYHDGQRLSLEAAAAGPATQRYLLGSLIFGSLVIFPALFYLFRIFKLPQAGSDRATTDRKSEAEPDD